MVVATSDDLFLLAVELEAITASVTGGVVSAEIAAAGDEVLLSALFSVASEVTTDELAGCSDGAVVLPVAAAAFVAVPSFVVEDAGEVG